MLDIINMISYIGERGTGVYTYNTT
jgi:hypothetical protein